MEYIVNTDLKFRSYRSKYPMYRFDCIRHAPKVLVAPHTEVSGGANDQVNYCLQVQAGVTYDFVVALGGASCQECLWDSCVVLVRAVGPLLTIPHPLARAQAAPSLG